MARQSDNDSNTARDARTKTTMSLGNERMHSVTAEISQSRNITDASLSEERDLAETRLNARDELISVLSHDLKNPLSAMSLNVGMILQELPPGAPGDKVRKRAVSIQRRISDMVLLISSLLDAEFIMAGKLPMKNQVTNLVEQVRDVVDEFMTLAEHKEVHLELIVPNCLVMTMCDPQRIRQVMSNLISNAIKFATKQSLVLVELRLLDREIRFSVANEGETIPESKRDTIFDRYVKLGAHEPYSPMMIGRGLGLWISRWIITQCEGKIWVQPTVDGNIFVFTLPVVNVNT